MPVYVHVTVASRADTVAGSSLLLIAESVAGRIRTTLGAAPDSVPDGARVLAALRSHVASDTTVSRARTRVDSAALRVVARRDGSLRWAPVLTPPSPPTLLLESGLTAAKEAGEIFLPAELFAADSIVFTLHYLYRYDVVGGRVRPRAFGPATLAAFTLRTPVEKQAAVAAPITVHYPTSSIMGRAEGVVIVQFVIDTTGRAMASTVHDVWPKDRPRLTGDLGEYYQAFFAATKEAIARGQFTPAEIAGCKVRQLVQQPFTYRMRP